MIVTIVLVLILLFALAISLLFGSPGQSTAITTAISSVMAA